MALNAKKIPKSGGGNFKRPPALPAGTYPARLVQIIDLGMQEQRPFQGQEKPPKNEIYLTYELLDEFMLDEEGNEIEDKPRWISETLPMHSIDSDLAKSTKRYVALDPELKHDWDWSALVGTGGMVTLTHSPDKSGKKDDDGNLVVYNNISSVQTMRAKDAAKAAALVNEPKVFSMDDPDLDVFLSLPDWLRDKIKEGLEYEGSPLAKALSNISEADEVAKRRNKDEEQKPKAEKPKVDNPDESDNDDDW